MKSNLKEQVAELQKDLNHQFKRIETLTDRVENYMVPRLQKLDKEIVVLSSGSNTQRISELEDWRGRQKQTNEIFFDQFKEFVNGMTDGISPEEAMTMYQEMISKFLKLSGKFAEPKHEIVVEELEDDSK